MSDKQIKVRAIEEFEEYLANDAISCEVFEGEEFTALLNEESGEYFAIDSKGREVYVGELNSKGTLELDECFELMVDDSFGSYAAHQPNYEGFKQLGKLDDYVYQSLAHMGNASHQMSWALTVLDHADVPNELTEEIRQTVVAISDLQEKLRTHRQRENEMTEQEKTLLVLNGYIDESQKTGFASVPTHVLNIIKLRYSKLATSL